MLERWHDFYVLLGTASAALVALLFVAASIGASVFTPESTGATRTYMSPVVFHYTNTLFLSLIALIPDFEAHDFAIVIAAAALGSLCYSIYIAARVMRHSYSDLADRIAYGSVPVVAYACGLISAWLMLSDKAKAGLYLLAAAALLVLVVNIRNAWDLMISLARRHAERINHTASP
jgi:hypothetical protein